MNQTFRVFDVEELQKLAKKGSEEAICRLGAMWYRGDFKNVDNFTRTRKFQLKKCAELFFSIPGHQDSKNKYIRAIYHELGRNKIVDKKIRDLYIELNKKKAFSRGSITVKVQDLFEVISPELVDEFQTTESGYKLWCCNNFYCNIEDIERYCKKTNKSFEKFLTGINALNPNLSTDLVIKNNPAGAYNTFRPGVPKDFGKELFFLHAYPFFEVSENFIEKNMNIFLEKNYRIPALSEKFVNKYIKEHVVWSWNYYSHLSSPSQRKLSLDFLIDKLNYFKSFPDKPGGTTPPCTYDEEARDLWYKYKKLGTIKYQNINGIKGSLVAHPDCTIEIFFKYVLDKSSVQSSIPYLQHELSFFQQFCRYSKHIQEILNFFKIDSTKGICYCLSCNDFLTLEIVEKNQIYWNWPCIIKRFNLTVDYFSSSKNFSLTGTQFSYIPLRLDIDVYSYAAGITRDFIEKDIKESSKNNKPRIKWDLTELAKNDIIDIDFCLKYIPLGDCKVEPNGPWLGGTVPHNAREDERMWKYLIDNYEINAIKSVLNFDEEIPEIPEIPRDRECPVCLDSIKNTAFNCGHQCCEDCAEKLNSCPVCNKKIFLRLRLY